MFRIIRKATLIVLLMVLMSCQRGKNNLSPEPFSGSGFGSWQTPVGPKPSSKSKLLDMEGLEIPEQEGSNADHLLDIISLNEALRQLFRERVCQARAESSADPLVAFPMGLYLNLFGRIPSSDEIQYWKKKLANANSPARREGIALEFLHSPENRGEMIERAFQAFLGREPDGGGISFFNSLFNNHGVSQELLFKSILGSLEYFARNGGQLPGFVQGLFRDLLGRNADPGGIQHWSKIAAGYGRETAALGVFSSGEFRQNFIGALYRSLLGREPDAGGRNFWLSEMARGRDMLRTEAGILGSKEYFDTEMKHHIEFLQRLCVGADY